MLLACAMGVQVSTARRLAVPDVPTIALTMALTGLVADSRIAGGTGTNLRVRTATVVALLAGAVAGGALVLHVSVTAAIALATVLVATVGATVLRFATRTDGSAWRPPARPVPDQRSRPDH